MIFRYLLQNIFCATAALVAATASAGDGWRHLEPQAQREIEPDHFLLGTDGSLWLFGADGIRRTDAGGATTGWLPVLTSRNWMTWTPPGLQLGTYAAGLPTADHGAVFAAPDHCTLTRVDAAARLRWVQQLGEACDFAVVAGDAVWVANPGAVYRLNADGDIERQFSNERGIAAHVEAMPQGGAVVALSAGVPARSTLTRYDSAGTQLWTITRDALIADMAASVDGTLTVAAVTADGIAIYRIGSDGTPVMQYLPPRDPARNEGDLALRLAPDGSASVTTAYYTATTATHTVYRFGADGRFVWRTEVCQRPSNAYMPPDAVLPLRGGGVAVACSSPDGARFTRFDASGAPVVQAPLPTQSAGLGLRSDGTLQALGYAVATNARRLYVVDADGQPVDAPVPMAAELVAFVDQQLADDASYVLSRSALRAGPQRLSLSKIDANGAVAWRRAFDVIAPHARLAVAGGQACVAQSRPTTSPWTTGFPAPPPPPPAPVSIACVASSDGTDRWSRVYPTDGAEHYFGATGDGTFVHVRSEGSTHEIVRYDNTGNEVVRAAHAGFVQSAAVGASGDVAAGVFDRDTQRLRVVRYDAQGAAHPIDANPTQGAEVVGTVAGQVHAIVRRLTGRYYEGYGADGQRAWARSMDGLFGPPAPDRTGAAMYFAEHVPGSNPLAPAVRVVRLRASDGEIQWRSAPVFLAPDDMSSQRNALDASGDIVAFAHATSNRIHVARFDARDGASIGERIEACTTYCAAQRAVAVDARGVVRVALPITQPPATGMTAAVVALPDTDAQPAVRLDQAGLGGAWWAPYANGEGFVVDWLPAARTWFMPWFTFSPYNSPPWKQRWYTVAGTIAAGATQAELPILETTGGTFDVGGGTTVRQVGVAMLRFNDCDNGTLRYTFSASHNNGEAGTITLSRLSAATHDCTLADGTLQSRTVAPVNGFDARMSGSWYEEATSGQGLQFVMQPGGVFFAPWFTFDPPGSAGNPGRQRWYTLQGSLAGATDGRVEVPIVETTGGAFDSAPATRMAIVGKATLTMRGCDRATLDYAFDATAGDLAGRTGSIDLVKAGGCMP